MLAMGARWAVGPGRGVGESLPQGQRLTPLDEYGLWTKQLSGIKLLKKSCSELESLPQVKLVSD